MGCVVPTSACFAEVQGPGRVTPLPVHFLCRPTEGILDSPSSAGKSCRSAPEYPPVLVPVLSENRNLMWTKKLVLRPPSPPSPPSPPVSPDLRRHHPSLLQSTFEGAPRFPAASRGSPGGQLHLLTAFFSSDGEKVDGRSVLGPRPASGLRVRFLQHAEGPRDESSQVSSTMSKHSVLRSRSSGRGLGLWLAQKRDKQGESLYGHFTMISPTFISKNP